MSVLFLHSVSIMHFQNSWLASSLSEHVCTGSPLKLSAPCPPSPPHVGRSPRYFLPNLVLTRCLHTFVHATFPAWNSLSLPKARRAWSLWYCSDPSLPWILVLTALTRVLALAYSVIVVHYPIVPSIILTQTCIKHWLWQVPWQTLKIKKQGRITRWFYLLGKTHTQRFSPEWGTSAEVLP